MGKPRPPKDPSLQRITVRLDWKAYFLEFCKVHGEPVLDSGRLLFRDGWTYSSTQYEGPEWGPPQNHKELDEIVLRYWQLRQATLSKLMLKLDHEYNQLKAVIISRSVPPQQVVFIQDGESRKRAYRPLNLEPLEQKIAWVKTDLEECAERLKEIQDHYKEKTDEPIREGLDPTRSEPSRNGDTGTAPS